MVRLSNSLNGIIKRQKQCVGNIFITFRNSRQQTQYNFDNVPIVSKNCSVFFWNHFHTAIPREPVTQRNGVLSTHTTRNTVEMNAITFYFCQKTGLLQALTSLHHSPNFIDKAHMIFVVFKPDIVVDI